MLFKPVKAYGGWVGLLLGTLLFGFALWGIGYSLDASDRVLKLLLYVPTYLFLAIFVYFLLGAFNLAYKVEPDGLVLRCSLHSKKIKWNEFDEIIEVKGRANLSPFISASWKGFEYGLYSAKGLGSVRMYATHTDEGFIYLKTQKGFYGITPADPNLLSIILEKAGKPLTTIDMDKMSPEEKGEGIHDDKTFKLYHNLNTLFLLIFAGYLAMFFPGSGAPRFIILLMVLALALYIFNVGNAKRIYQISESGSHFMLLMQLFVTGMFIILAVFGISFQAH
ncbi:MAG: PH domain-containing protein [Syntrophomonadaceae bacterium]